jgi:hypothetical protein
LPPKRRSGQDLALGAAGREEETKAAQEEAALDDYTVTLH